MSTDSRPEDPVANAERSALDAFLSVPERNTADVILRTAQQHQHGHHCSKDQNIPVTDPVGQEIPPCNDRQKSHAQPKGYHLRQGHQRSGLPGLRRFCTLPHILSNPAQIAPRTALIA